MDLTGRRQSSNVDDRRGMSGAQKAGIGGGIIGAIIAMVIAYLSGGNPLEAGMQAFQQSLGNNTEVSGSQEREFTEEEQALALFSSQVLASTEDVFCIYPPCVTSPYTGSTIARSK